MNILFPSLPARIREIDSSFELEREAAIKAGFDTILVDTNPWSHQEFSDISDAINITKDPANSSVLYRGWIVKPVIYNKICSLIQKIIVDQKAYEFCYYLSNWYEALGPELTPKSILFNEFRDETHFDVSNEVICSTLNKEFGNSPLILKDYIKSAKHNWYDACFITNASDASEVTRVTRNFLDIQGKNLVGGLVYREYIPFKRIGLHPKSKMPLIHEWRFFVYNKKVFYKAPYWSTGDYGDPPSDDCLKPILDKMESPFYSVDMAQKDNGEWFNVEVGDGGSSGIPEGGNIEDFYKALINSI